MILNPTVLVTDLLTYLNTSSSSSSPTVGLDGSLVTSITVLGCDVLMSRPHSNTSFVLMLLRRTNPTVKVAVFTEESKFVGSKIKRIAQEAGVKKGGDIWVGPRWRDEVKQYLRDSVGGCVYDEDWIVSRYDSEGHKELEEAVEVLVEVVWEEVKRTFKGVREEEVKQVVTNERDGKIGR